MIELKGKESLFQWDTNQRFTNVECAYLDYPIGEDVYRVRAIDGECIIPDEFLQTYGRKSVYEVYDDGTYTERSFLVYQRPKPADYVYTITTIEPFESLIAKVEAAIADMYKKAADGEFDGEDGFSPEVSIEEFPEERRHHLVIIDAEGPNETDIFDGEDGEPGADGLDGLTPELKLENVDRGTQITITNYKRDPDDPSIIKPTSKTALLKDGYSPIVSLQRYGRTDPATGRVTRWTEMSITQEDGRVIKSNIYDGDTPIKGIDYMTEEEMSKLVKFGYQEVQLGTEVNLTIPDKAEVHIAPGDIFVAASDDTREANTAINAGIVSVERTYADSDKSNLSVLNGDDVKLYETSSSGERKTIASLKQMSEKLGPLPTAQQLTENFFRYIRKGEYCDIADAPYFIEDSRYATTQASLTPRMFGVKSTSKEANVTATGLITPAGSFKSSERVNNEEKSTTVSSREITMSDGENTETLDINGIHKVNNLPEPEAIVRSVNNLLPDPTGNVTVPTGGSGSCTVIDNVDGGVDVSDGITTRTLAKQETIEGVVAVKKSSDLMIADLVEKSDLDDVKDSLSQKVGFTDYATNTKAGIVQGSGYGINISSDHRPYCAEFTAEQYNTLTNLHGIGKGTLENRLAPIESKIGGEFELIEEITLEEDTIFRMSNVNYKEIIINIFMSATVAKPQQYVYMNLYQGSSIGYVGVNFSSYNTPYASYFVKRENGLILAGIKQPANYSPSGAALYCSTPSIDSGNPISLSSAIAFPAGTSINIYAR